MVRKKLERLFKLLPPLFLRDIKERYAGSAIGVVWTFLHPLLFVLLYWAVFSQILKVRIKTDTGEIPFIAFLLCGLLPWFALQDGVIRGASSIVDKRNVIKKVLFPTELFPLSSVMSSFAHYGVGFIGFLFVFFLWKGQISVLQVLFIPGLLLVQIILTSGLALFFSALSVYLRDIIQILVAGFQVFFYLSTILYPKASIPEKLKVIIAINPVTALASSYQEVILYNKFPETGEIVYLLIVTTVAVSLGIYVFKKLKSGFADVL